MWRPNFINGTVSSLVVTDSYVIQKPSNMDICRLKLIFFLTCSLILYCGRRHNKRYDSTSLLKRLHTVAVYIQVLYRVTRVRRTGLAVSRGVGSSPQYLSLKFLRLGSKLIQIIIFTLNTLRGCSMRIQNTPRATLAWILLVNARRGKSYWLYIWIRLEDALCTFKILREQHQHESY